MMPLYQRITNMLITLDQFLWVFLTLGKGYPDETISAAMHRMNLEGKLIGRIFEPIIDNFFYIFLLESKHCLNSYISERENKQLPKHYRKEE